MTSAHVRRASAGAVILAAMAAAAGVAATPATAGLTTITVSDTDIRVGRPITVTVHCEVRSTVAVAIDVDPYSAEPGDILEGRAVAPDENLLATVQWTPTTAGTHTIQAYGCALGSPPDYRPPTSTLTVTVQAALPTVPAWQQGAVYNVGDVVTFDGAQYRAIQAHTAHDAGWTPAATPALWQKLPAPGGPAVSTWAQGLAYNTGDVVTFDGAQYRCLQAHTAHDAGWTPAATPALWQRL
ncbi:carbohydrate-binding protein [Nocardia sp. NPDC055321]